MKAAESRFLADGYTRTSVRAIARDAGVDHSLVNYYFGGKEGLFTTVMTINLMPSRVIAAALVPRGELPPSQRAERFLEMVVGVWDSPAASSRLAGLVRGAVADEALRASFAGFVGARVYGVLSERLGGPDPHHRAAAIASTMSGFIFTRYVLEAEPIVSMSRTEIVRMLLPSIAVQMR